LPLSERGLTQPEEIVERGDISRLDVGKSLPYSRTRSFM